MNEQQLQALSALAGTSNSKESKTVDYKVSVTNKAGAVKSAGILKLWKRFSEDQMNGIIAILGGSKRVTIELLTNEQAVSDDEF